jgi:hypothetical protein
MLAALALEPLRGDWRQELVAWLIRWGEAEEAHRQARIGVQLSPHDPGLRRALESAVGAVARGTPPTNDR